MNQDQFEEMLEAEVYFCAVYHSHKNLPESSNSSEFEKLVRYVDLVKIAHEQLQNRIDADYKLQKAQDADLLRPERKGISMKIRSLKEAVKCPELLQIRTLQ